MSVSTEPRQSPPRGPGGLKREHVIWVAGGLLVLVLGFALAALVAERRVNKDEGQLLGAGQVGGAVTSIGPLNGTDLALYVPARKEELAKASGERAAVVSFDRYVTANEAISAAGSMNVIAMLAAAPGTAPSTVKGDIRAWAKDQKEHLTNERKETAELLKTVDDPEYKPFYQSEVARLDKALAAVNPDGPVVFAVVVKGPSADLQALHKRPGTRLVDVGASAKVTDSTEYRGVRPEQSATVNNDDPRPF